MIGDLMPLHLRNLSYSIKTPKGSNKNDFPNFIVWHLSEIARFYCEPSQQRLSPRSRGTPTDTNLRLNAVFQARERLVCHTAEGHK